MVLRTGSSSFSNEVARGGTRRLVWTRASPQVCSERAFTNPFFDKRLDAIPDLSKVTALDPKKLDGLRLAGRCLPLLGETHARYRRLRTGRRARARDSRSPTATWGKQAGRRGRMNEVDAWLAKCYALDPTEHKSPGPRSSRTFQAKEEQAARDMAAIEQLVGRSPAGAVVRGGGRGRRGPGCSYTNYTACNAEAAGILGGRANRVRPVHSERVRLVRGGQSPRGPSE